MQHLSTTFRHILPYLTSASSFSSAHNEKSIESDIRELSDISESMRHGGADGAPAFPDQDPTLPIVSRLLVSNVENAYLLFRLGQKEPARQLLRGIVSQCSTCHLRGPDEKAEAAYTGTSDVAGLGVTDRIAIDLALRRYEGARRAIMGTLSDPNVAVTHPAVWMGAAKAGLIIAVQIDDSPERAQIIAQTIASSTLPALQRDHAKCWVKAIRAWRDEPDAVSKISRLALAHELVAQAASLSGDTACSGEADIFNLRATSLLHAYLRGGAKAIDVSQALLLLGKAYEGLVSFEMWHLPNLYYEACVLSSPHSPVALECFDRYRHGMFVDPSVWVANTLPPPVAEDMLLLENLAIPTNKQP